LTARIFGNVDYFVGPSHERSNWAMGLGIPMFILHPLIGPYSPINRDILVKRGVADEIKSNAEAANFSDRLVHLIETNGLVDMARLGFNKIQINGFQEICRTLIGLNENV